MDHLFISGGKNKRGVKQALADAEALIDERDKELAAAQATIAGLRLSVGRLESKLAKQGEEIGKLKATAKQTKTTAKKTTPKK